MPDPAPTAPDPKSTMLDEFLRAQAAALRAGDADPATLREWETRRAKLRTAMFAAMGPFPEKPCPLEPREVGVLRRAGYRIERLLLQTRPGVWMTASAYVPEGVSGKVPGVLAVHGHWPWARRDPVVQARCLGLVKLGFFVLAVDAFGAGERHPNPGPGAYHGALLGGALWPAGHTLLGMQVYENRRAVDYLRARPEVDGDRLGVTGASGGGNQTMYAGALDERLKAVVAVCSVGTYQSYLRVACCVCEVLPGALRFTEEGDVLGLVAPRALMVINATQDSINFSVGEARKSLDRARAVYRLYGEPDRVAHVPFESPHAYNRPMREAMYGWMTRWLKGEGDGKPIPEPEHEVEKPEDLACYPPGQRPESFVFPTTFAAREADRLVAPFRDPHLDHPEAWESLAGTMRATLAEEVLAGGPKRPPRPAGRLGRSEDADGVLTASLKFQPEPGITLPGFVRLRRGEKDKRPAFALLHPDGQAEALKHPMAAALVERGAVVVSVDLRGTGATQPVEHTIGGAPDHNSAEHAVWLGRPLLGLWVYDVRYLLDWMAAQPGHDATRLVVVGIGQVGLVALCAAAVDDRIAAVAAVDAPVTYVTEQAYGAGTRMGLLAPGILRVGDVPHLAALAAPRRLLVLGGTSPQGTPRTLRQLQDAYAFTRKAYGLLKAADQLKVVDEGRPADLTGFLLGEP
jgi:dienelactone hydrolase